MTDAATTSKLPLVADRGQGLWRAMIATVVSCDEASGCWQVIGCDGSILVDGLPTGQAASSWARSGGREHHCPSLVGVKTLA